MATFSRLSRSFIVACGLLSLCAASAAQNVGSLGASSRIAGTVVDAANGRRLERARVSIVDASNPQNLQSTMTSEDGRFEFKQIPPGKYGLQGAKRGFITSSYEAHEEFSTAIVTGAGFNTEHLVLRLAPTAVISGKVFDESGEPIRNATVSLYRENRRIGVGRIVKVRSESTDDRGGYEFARLDEGSYFIAVKATPWYATHPLAPPQASAENAPAADSPFDVAYPLTYYGDATEPDDASAIPVRGGDRLQADIHLNPVPSLHLLLHVPDTGQNGVAMPVFSKPAFDGMEIFQGGGMQMVSPGVFDISGIPPGHYTVLMRGNGRGDQANSEIDATTNGQELDLAKMERASNLKASVQLLGEGTLPPHLGIALRNSKMRIVAWEEVNAKSEIEFPGIAPGMYEVLAFSQAKAFSVVHISSKSGETAGHNLNVATGSSDKISFTLVGGGGSVEGFAKRAGKPMAGAMVVLVHKDPESHRELFRRDQTNQDGSFTLADVIPGSYTVVAIENGWDLDWSRPGVIASYNKHGKAVIVSDHAQNPTRLSEAVELQPR